MDYEMFKGETFVKALTALNKDGSIKNLTGANVIFTVKNWYSEPDLNAIAQLRTPASGVVITAAAAGQYTVTMAPSFTSILTGDGDIQVIYDIKCIDASGVQSILQGGNLIIHPSVTRATV